MQLSQILRDRLPAEVASTLGQYGDDILRFNPVENLVSRVDPAQEVRRLLEESARAGLELGLAAADRVLDVGSGGGFPALVWASQYPETQFVLAERRRARCDFLEREVRRLRLRRVTVFPGDVRALEAGAFTLASAKAVTDTAEFLEWVAPHLEADGRAVVFHREGWPGPSEGDWEVERGWTVLEDDDRPDRWVYVLRRKTSG